MNLSKVEIHWKCGSTFGKHGNTFGKHGNTFGRHGGTYEKHGNTLTTRKYIENKEIHWRSVYKYPGAHGEIH